MAAPKLPDFRHPGSFQRGRQFRSGDPLNAVWRYVERVSTIDGLETIASARGISTDCARPAALRFRQAVELRQASSSTSPLTRPLLLYYSALNLVRGVLLVADGSIGAPSHGLTFSRGGTLLDSAAIRTKNGTFLSFERFLGASDSDTTTSSISLAELLAQIPELIEEFNLLKRGPPSIVPVSVDARMSGRATLRFYLQETSADEFERNWQELFPWFKDECDLANEPFSLMVKEKLETSEQVTSYLESRLLHDLQLRDNALWFDHVSRPNVALLQRPLAYLAALFILSNVVRYEPHLLADVTKEPTSEGFVVSSFLDAAERFFPQLILRHFGGPIYFS